MKRRLLVSIVLLIVFTGYSSSQIFNQPNCGLKSHETLMIKKIEANSKEATFFMSIENRIQNGSFCADKNIYIIYPDGSRGRLISSKGIPVCPDSHRFNLPGEKLDFTLTFPPLQPGTESIDLIEDCSDNCFSFYGVILNQDLNDKLDAAFALADSGEKSKALDNFINIAAGEYSETSGIYAILCTNIIKLAKDTGNDSKASEWYKKLQVSGAHGLSQYLKYLNDQGIRY